MNRRTFLNAVFGSGSVAWLTGGQALFSAGEISAYPNPVPFAQNAAAAGLDDAQESSLFAVSDAATQQLQTASYPQSVASGDPSANGIVLWTRVDPSVQIAGDQIAWQIASDPAFLNVLVKGTGTISAAADHTVKLPISKNALQPFTLYYYRFIYNQVASRTGRFKTLPALGSSLAELKLGYVVCQDYGNGYYTALAHLAQEHMDYVVHLGDYIYETISSNFQGSPARTVPPFPSGSTTVPLNVDDYRHLYKVYRSDVNQQAVHEQFAYIQLWDDHEFANDCHQDFHPDNNTASVTANTPQPSLRQAASQAWAEYGLADVVFHPESDWE